MLTWNSRCQRPLTFALLLLATPVTCVVTDYKNTKVGDQICFEGFVMDYYCIQRGRLLDEESSRTLERPERHSVHCLIDVVPCRNSNFELLASPPAGSVMYERAFQFTDEGKAGLIAEASAVGAVNPSDGSRCTECKGTMGSLGRGFRAEVYGIVTAAALGDGTPPTVHIVDAMASHDRQGAPSCTGEFPTKQNPAFGVPLPVTVVAPVPVVPAPAPVVVVAPAPVLPVPVDPVVVVAPAPVGLAPVDPVVVVAPAPVAPAQVDPVVVVASAPVGLAPVDPVVVVAPAPTVPAPVAVVAPAPIVPAQVDPVVVVAPAPTEPTATTVSERELPMGMTDPSTVSVGDNICFEGFVMDYFCIERGTLLDNPSVQTLIGPERHSVHCLIDISRCRNTAFELLKKPEFGETEYTRAFQFDGASKEGIISIAAAVGDTRGCRVCTAETGMLRQGFRAEVYGVVSELTDPPTIQIVDAVSSNGMENPCMRTSMPEQNMSFNESEEKSQSAANGNMNGTEIAFMTLAFLGVGAVGVVSVFGNVLFPNSKEKAPMATSADVPEEATAMPKPREDANSLEATTY